MPVPAPAPAISTTAATEKWCMVVATASDGERLPTARWTRTASRGVAWALVLRALQVRKEAAQLVCGINIRDVPCRDANN